MLSGDSLSSAESSSITAIVLKPNGLGLVLGFRVRVRVRVKVRVRVRVRIKCNYSNKGVNIYHSLRVRLLFVG